MGPATTTTGTLPQQLSTYYDKQMLTRLELMLQFYKLGEQKNLPANQGTTVKWNRYANLPASITPITDGVIPTAQGLTSAQVTATVSQYGGYVTTSDFIQMTAISDVVKNGIEVISYQANLSIDTIIRNILNSGATLTWANAKTATNNLLATDVFTAAELRKQRNTLKRLNVLPYEGRDFICVTHTQSLFDLQSETNNGGFIEASKYDKPENLVDGEVGKLYGVRLIETQNAFSGVNTQPVNYYYNYFIGKEAFGVLKLSKGNLQTIVHGQGSAGSADPLNQIGTIGWKTFFTAVVLDPARIIIDAAGSAS